MVFFASINIIQGQMSNSSLVSYTKLSPNHSGKRTHSIDRITPHCYVGQVTVERIGDGFAQTSRQASCNYGIAKDGRVALIVDEANRSWCSSSNANDQRAVTIECASDTKDPYAMNDAVYNTLVNLCVDICKRNGKKKLLWFGDKTKTLAYEPKEDEMVITVHRWFAAKACPGDWLYARLGQLAATVTARLNGTSEQKTSNILYRVQIGAFLIKGNADKQLAKVQAKGFTDAFVTKIGVYYKVQVGAFSKKENAENMKNRVKTAGFDAIIVESK